MIRLAPPPEHDGAINALATQLAETAAAALEQGGLPLTATNTVALSRALTTALEHVRVERARAVRQARIDQRATWVQEQGLLSAAEAAQRLGLTLPELETARALALIAPAEVPPGLQATSAHFTRESWQYYRPSSALSAAARARIAHETLLTRLQAAERLGVSVPAFDQLRREHSLDSVEQAPGQNGSPLKLYRTDAVLHLTAATAPAQRPQRRDA